MCVYKHSSYDYIPEDRHGVPNGPPFRGPLFTRFAFIRKIIKYSARAAAADYEGRARTLGGEYSDASFRSPPTVTPEPVVVLHYTHITFHNPRFYAQYGASSSNLPTHTYWHAALLSRPLAVPATVFTCMCECECVSWCDFHMLKTLLTIGACVRTPFSIIMQQQSATPTPLAEGGAALLTADAISLSYAESFIFKDISFAIARGAKLALVGANGAGKSSLLKVLCGKLQPDTGSVDIARGVRSAYVEQEPSLPPGAPAADFIFSSDAPFARALAEYRAAVQAVDNGESDASERVGRAAAAMDKADAWGIEEEMQRLCATLEVDHLLSRDASSLSGGERKRVALAAALLSQPDLLLLDEPTNHLDIGAIRFLEGEIAARSLTALIVTHDRSFLSATCNEVLELSRTEVHRHRGDYEAFLASKQARLEAEGAATAAARNKLKTELAWVRDGQ